MLTTMVCGNCASGGWKGRCTVCKISYALLIIGGLNWGLVGIGGLLDMNLNVVNLILGWSGIIEHIVYIVVGVATASVLCGKCSCSKKGCAGGTCGTCAAGEGMKCEGGKCQGGKCSGMKDKSSGAPSPMSGTEMKK